MTAPPGLTSRRTLLAGSIMLPLGLLTACGTDTPAARDTDAAVRAEVASGEQAMIDLYNATIAAFPALSTKLTPIRDQHAAHLSAMDVAAPSPTAITQPAPASANDAVSALIAAERKATAGRTDACVKASTPQLAWALSLISASEASHVAWLSSSSS